MNQPQFEHHALASIGRVTATFGQRGTEYGDTWKECQWLALKAICRKYGLTVPEDLWKPIAAAVLCDVKYARLSGGYKDDSIIDGIAYNALLANVVKEVDEERAKQHDAQ